MSDLHLFTPIDLSEDRASSFCEKTLSKISNYFYLGGKKVNVYYENYASITTSKLPWYIIAGKVVSYVVLFPITFMLLTANFGLRRKYKYTIVDTNASLVPKNTQPQTDPKIIIPKQQPINRSSIDSGISTDPLSIAKPTCGFPLFRIRYLGYEHIIVSDKDLETHAKALIDKVFNQHKELRVHIPFSPKALEFYKKLEDSLEIKSVAGVENEYILQPKATVHHHENLTVYTYSNGVIEQVESSTISPEGDRTWNGCRFHPNGMIEKGDFTNFTFNSGKIIHSKDGIETISYRNPAFIIISDSISGTTGIIRDIDTNELVAVSHKEVKYISYFYPLDEAFITSLEKIMISYKHDKVDGRFLIDHFPNHIKDLVDHIFNTKRIFEYINSKKSLIALLEVVRDKKFNVDLRLRNENNETLLDVYLNKKTVIDLLLSIDPTLEKELFQAKIRAFKEAINNLKKKVFDWNLKQYVELTPEEAADRIFKDIPDGLSVKDIVEYIFEGKESNASLLLQSLQMKFPEFKLTSFDLIRKAIADGKFITNQQLNDLVKKHNLEHDQEKIDSCHDLAFRWERPYIYKESQIPVQSHEYTLNFIWLNKSPQDRSSDSAQNIFNDGLDESENAAIIDDPDSMKDKHSFTYRLYEWVKTNPEAQINLWYDSALVTEKARKLTLESLGRISKNIKLKDIRTIPTVLNDKNINKNMHPSAPVYHRVRVLKAVVADHLINGSQDNTKYCVISDFDVEPMTPKHLFDQRTVNYLNETGCVYSIKYLDFPFLIYNKENERLKSDFKKQPSNDADTKPLLSKKVTVVLNHPVIPAEIKNEKSMACHFEGDDTIPYIFERIFSKTGLQTSRVQRFKDWKAEPLPLIEE